MSRLEHSVDLFRGQIEETLGRMQRSLGEMQGPSGTITAMRGRGLEMRGKARQSMARFRLGMDKVSEAIHMRPEAYTPLATLLVLGIGLGALAIFSPRTLWQAWDWVSHLGRRAQIQTTQMTSEIRRNY